MREQVLHAVCILWKVQRYFCALLLLIHKYRTRLELFLLDFAVVFPGKTIFLFGVVGNNKFGKKSGFPKNVVEFPKLL